MSAGLRILDVRRHSLTQKGEGRGRGSDLSAAGVRLAREIGASCEAYAYVATSTVPRARETALAMGFAVDVELAVLGDITEEVRAEVGRHERWSWPQPFVRFAEVVAAGGPTAQLARAQLAAWLDVAGRVSLGGRALVVTHGTLIESGMVAALPDGDHASWGASFRNCEGARLYVDQGRFELATLLRVPKTRIVD